MIDDRIKMSFKVTTGPPKPKDDLSSDEGLATKILVVRVLGELGMDEPMDFYSMMFGPNGMEENVDLRLLMVIDMLLLDLVIQGTVANSRSKLHLISAKSSIIRALKGE